MQCSYNGLWSPSGTNWQPVRAVELDTDQMTRLAPHVRSGRTLRRPGIALLARTEYESMLGDAARVARLKLESQAEFIDVGIYAAACELTAAAAGAPAAVEVVCLADQPRVTAEIARILAQRCEHYDTPMRCRAESLIEALKSGEYVVDGLFCPSPAETHTSPEAPSTSEQTSFDRLVAARCSQRVASPNQELSLADFASLWDVATRAVDPAILEHIRYSAFTWHDAVPRLIGKAMFEGLYGEGADLQTGEGGQGGMLDSVNLDNLVAYLAEQPNAAPSIQEINAAGPDRRLELASTLAIPAGLIPRRLREFILSKPQFHLNDDTVTSRNGQPLTIEQFVRMVRLLTLSFGKFFLSFQNTHPITAVLLVQRVADPELHASIYRSLGRLMAAMTFACRARGWVSIIKGGPTEINRAGVGQVVAQHTEDKAVRNLVEEGQFIASLTFQVGYPLGPDEIVTASGQQHTGLMERSRDKRSPRASIGEHYFHGI